MIWILANWKTALGIAGTAIFAALLLITTIDRNQWRAAARSANATLALVKPAQELALAKAQAAIAAKEAYYKEHANDGDTNYGTIAASADDAVTEYIRTHRVPVCPSSGAASAAPVSPQGSNPSVPASVPSATVVSDDDVRACAGAVAYGIAAHDWAVGLQEDQK